MSEFTKIPCWSSNASPPLAEVTKEKCARNELNKEQLAALEVLTGRHVINAGAGSGKSSVLIARMLLINKTYPDSKVLMISFTKKSAMELRDRIGGRTNVTISTFHSLAYHIMRSAGLRFTVITSEAEQESVIGRLIKKRKTTIEEVQQSLHHIEVEDADTKAVREEYLAYLQNHQQTTFDTMQIFALQLLQKDKALLASWWARADFLLVDEGQDQDAQQLGIIELLSQRTNNLCVCSDTRQSIYSFRGAVPDAIGKIAEIATQYDLSINYRSNRAILGLANEVMAKDKPLLAAVENPAPIYPKYIMATDGLDEARAVVDEIAFLHKQGQPYKEMTVLFRSCAASSYVVQELLKRKIPAISKGAITLTHTKPPYCGVVRLFRFMLKPGDKDCFKAIMPILYLRKGMLQTIVTIVVKTGCSLMEATQKLNLPFFHKEYLSELSDAMIDASKMTPSQAALHLLQHGYGKYIGPELTEAIKHMADELKEYSSITAYLNFLDDLKEQAEAMRQLTATSTDFLELMTIHASKGKEFDTVFLIGAQDGVLPSNHDGVDIEEERRLLYVAVTRAKERLYISFPRTSENHKDPNEVSRFLREIF